MRADFKTRLLYTIPLLLLFVAYFLLNRNLEPKFNFSLYVDHLIPFSPPFGVLYFSYLILLWGGIGYGFFCFPLSKYKCLILSLITVQVVAYLVYILIPGTISRPHVAGDGFFLDLIRVIYLIDMPANQTPSLHVANSWLLALELTNRRLFRFTVMTWALLIVISTMLIKQHHFVDVASGLMLGTLVYIAFDRYYPNEMRAYAEPTGKS